MHIPLLSPLYSPYTRPQSAAYPLGEEAILANITEIDGTAKATQKGTKQKKEEEPRRVFSARVRQGETGREGGREGERERENVAEWRLCKCSSQCPRVVVMCAAQRSARAPASSLSSRRVQRPIRVSLSRSLLVSLSLSLSLGVCVRALIARLNAATEAAFTKYGQNWGWWQRRRQRRRLRHR